MVKKVSTILLILASLLANAQEYRFYVEANKKEVPMGKTLQLTYRFVGGRPSNFEPPKLENFDYATNIGQRSETNIVNNKVSRSIAFIFSVKPKSVGTFTIPPAKVTINGNELKSDEITIKVVDQSQADKGVYDQIAENLFIKAYISKSTVYTGEQVKVTFKLFKVANMPIAELEYKTIPEYDGFWKEVLIDKQKFQFQDEVVDGIRYQTGILESVILFPQKSGEIIIDPYVLHTKIPVQSRRSGYPSIFDNFFGSYKYYDYDLKAPSLKLTVKDLPAGKPKGYSSLVGKFNFDAALTATEVEVDDAVTLNITVEGQGNLKLLEPYNIELPTGIEDYPSKTHDKISAASGVLSGSRRFELLMFPRREGIFKLPPVSFSYFDVEQEKYITYTEKDLSFKVGKGEQVNSVTTNEGGVATNVQSGVDYLNKDIEFIRFNNIKLFAKGYTPFMSGFHILFTVLPFGILATLLVVNRRREDEEKDVVGSKMKRATGQAKKRLQTAKKLLDTGSDEAFYNEVAKAVFGFLRDKFAIQEAELSKSVISQKLIRAKVEETLISETEQLIDDCEFARFAPGDKTGKMEQVYNKAVNVISSIETSVSK